MLATGLLLAPAAAESAPECSAFEDGADESAYVVLADGRQVCEVTWVETPTSGTWTVPVGVTSLDVLAVGGGGGGGGGGESTGGGGGGGGVVISETKPVAGGDALTIEVGSSGFPAAAPSAPGEAGSPSSVVDESAWTVTADGGSGGAAGNTVAGDGGASDAKDGGAAATKGLWCDGACEWVAEVDGSDLLDVAAGGGGAGAGTTQGEDASVDINPDDPGAESFAVTADGGNGAAGEMPTSDLFDGVNDVYGSGGGGGAATYYAVDPGLTVTLAQPQGGSGGAGAGNGGLEAAHFDAADLVIDSEELATDGVANFGGGGGGGAGASGSGGMGGAGVVKIRFLVPRSSNAGGGPSVTPVTNTITLDANGGSCTQAVVGGPQGTWQALPDATACSKPGAILAGWRTADGMSTYQPGALVHLTGDNTLTAVWKAGEIPTDPSGSASAPTVKRVIWLPRHKAGREAPRLVTGDPSALAGRRATFTVSGAKGAAATDVAQAKALAARYGGAYGGVITGGLWTKPHIVAAYRS